MDFLDIRPTTKDESTRILSALSVSGSLSEAQQHLPTSIFEILQKNVQESGNYEEAVKYMKQYLNTIKDIKIYLPYEPSKLLYEKILSTFENLNPHRVLEFIVDESIIGGVKVAIDGAFYDESINNIVEKHLTTHS